MLQWHEIKESVGTYEVIGSDGCYIMVNHDDVVTPDNQYLWYNQLFVDTSRNYIRPIPPHNGWDNRRFKKSEKCLTIR